MNINNLLPAGEFARKFGFKSIIYGPPGSAKTPLINTCPRPVLLITEPGVFSVRGSKVPAFEAYTEPRIDEFFDWFFNSAETKNFDTLAVDSTSHMADIYLQDAKKTMRHGQQQYGYMAEKVMLHLRRLFFFPQKHTYLIAKETIDDQGVKRPYYPGRLLPVDMPHLYDAIIRVAKANVPNVGADVTAFQCQAMIDIVARNRTGNLDMFERPDFAYIANKAMTA